MYIFSSPILLVALDRSRKIKNFGDAGGHEYCLCERPDTCPPSGDPSHGNELTLLTSLIDSDVFAMSNRYGKSCNTQEYRNCQYNAQGSTHDK